MSPFSCPAPQPLVAASWCAVLSRGCAPFAAPSPDTPHRPSRSRRCSPPREHVRQVRLSHASPSPFLSSLVSRTLARFLSVFVRLTLRVAKSRSGVASCRTAVKVWSPGSTRPRFECRHALAPRGFDRAPSSSLLFSVSIFCCTDAFVLWCLANLQSSPVYPMFLTRLFSFSKCHSASICSTHTLVVAALSDSRAPRRGRVAQRHEGRRAMDARGVRGAERDGRATGAVEGTT